MKACFYLSNSKKWFGRAPRESDSFASPSHLATIELIPSQPIRTFAVRVEPSARWRILAPSPSSSIEMILEE
jgi:hypothetical protein